MYIDKWMLTFWNQIPVKISNLQSSFSTTTETEEWLNAIAPIGSVLLLINRKNVMFSCTTLSSIIGILNGTLVTPVGKVTLNDGWRR